jgi:alkanesulfonate monooxygenase SsuD/methylene tetrahydromethanopterin reductase-like flavin-dependent oxidoreductase (luciferase family)
MAVMDLRIMTEPQQGASYDTQLALAKASEAAGFSGYFRSDHYLTMSGDGLPGPTDAWVTLAGLARETSTIRLGTMLTAGTFRLPGGRVELGLGAGWFEAEHRAYGIPFPSARLGRLEEQLAIVTGLWSTPLGETFSYGGKYYQLTDSHGLPKPAQSEIPIIVGGNGPTRTPAIAAKFAHEFNVPFQSVAATAAQFGRVREAAGGRELTYSAAVTTCVGKDDAEVARRAAAIGHDVDELKANGAAGTPAEVVDRLSQFAEAGASRVYLQLMDMTDLDHVDLIASDVRSQLG